ncbi:pitrilysin family protein [Arsukibacterium sp.]|uniref:M16 family metallopeptidase n=1 Tax=Arsukibacterium sp. TaxID=1977258 RepID=UPI001BD3F321|nr:pitrilysin family protein [Arsukibacterium sp.]
MSHFFSKRAALTALTACCITLAGCSSAPEQTTRAATVSSATAGTTVKGFQLPTYQTLVLDNGLTLYLMPQHEVPLLSIEVVIGAGAVLDQQGGEAFLTSQSLLLGAGGKSKQQLEQETDFIGASLSTSNGKEASYLSMSFMQKDTTAMLDILAAVLMQPAFNPEEFSKLHARLVAQQQQVKESPRNVISRYFDSLLYGNHPYAKPNTGSEQSLAALDLAGVTGFYQRYYQPDNIAIAVAGDFTIAELRQQLSKRFANWQGKSAAKPALPAVAKPAAARVLLVDKADATETTLMFGGVGVSQNNPDYVGLEVINTILGGRFTSWLNDELRVNSGLTYGARSGFSSLSAGGGFQISTFTKTETTQQTLDLALATYNRLWQQGIDQATLDSAKAYVKGQFPPNYETNSQLADLLGSMHLYQFNKGYINDFEQKVDSLTLADTERLIKQYFPQQQLQFVLVGKASELTDLAQRLGEVTTVAIKDNGFSPQ